MQKKSLLIVVRNRPYFAEWFGGWIGDQTVRFFWNDFEIVGHFTHDQSLRCQADAVCFHAPDLRPSRFGRLPFRKPRGQRWVVMSMESEVNYPLLRNARWMR